MNILWIILGFMGGVIAAKNSAEMETPYVGAVILAMIAGCAVTWTAGYHGKRQAVASAVATAVANANAEAHAAAQANVTFYGMSPDQVMVPGQRVTDTQMVNSRTTQGEISHDEQRSDSPDGRERISRFFAR